MSYEQFKKECEEEIRNQGMDEEFRARSSKWIERAQQMRYSYHFEWLGRPIIQYPQDILALQEIIWAVKPNVIVETGIAHGGSLIFSASMLELNAACGGPADAEVLGVDIDIREHNRKAVESHPMYKRVQMLEGSSIDPETIERVRRRVEGKERVLVFLDSNHTHDHVLAELQAYAPLVTAGSYCVVLDTLVEDLPEELFRDRPWGPGNNPKTAVQSYLKAHPEFEINNLIEDKLMISVAPSGYLKRVR